MRLAIQLAYAGGDFNRVADDVVAMEDAGLDIVWVAEAYGYDAVSFMGYLAARTRRVEIGSGIVPVFTRTPTLLAMTAAGIDALSGGRCILGLGASGPQVIEGFHGLPYDRPLARTREVVDICRQVWSRERPLEHLGACYSIPLSEPEGTGLGKPLKIINRPLRPRVPVYVAALGQRNLELAAEIADGWLPVFYLPERAGDVFGPSLARGAERRDPALGDLEVCAGGVAFIGSEEDADAVLNRQARGLAALYIGGMGASGQNFYNDLMVRYGYVDEAAEIQARFLAGDKVGAARMVPMDFLRRTNLCGTPEFVQGRIAAYRAAGVTVLNISPGDSDAARVVRQMKTLIEAG